MMYKRNQCTICSEAITNPVCARCYIKEIAQWLRDFGIGIIPMKIVINRIKEELNLPETPNDTSCLLCGRETLSACSYCFFLKAAKVLKELNFPDKVVRNFLEIFNYRHHHEDYYL